MIMSYISDISIKTDKTNPFPYNVPAVKYAKEVEIGPNITFFIGDNGTGKSTLLETLAYRLQLPHIDGSTYDKPGFAAAKALLPYLQVNYDILRTVGFFFRAEDFGDYMNSVYRYDIGLHQGLNDLYGEVPDHIIQEMKNNANYQIHHMRKQFGQELQSYSHGEAYMKIIQEKMKTRGIYILDEPEAALSPAKQLSLIYFICEHLQKFQSQMIIATHSPMLMAIPGAMIYEITEDGMTKTNFSETDHYVITRNFLNDPEVFLRHLISDQNDE